MTTPEVEFRGHVRTLLRTEFTVGEFNGIRDQIHDNPSNSATFPHIRFGEHNTLDNDTTCISSDENVLTLHVFSRKGGRDELGAITHRVKRALNDNQTAMSEHALCLMIVSGINYLTDDDGTAHAVVRIEAVIEDKTT